MDLLAPQKLSVPYFLLQSFIESSIKLKVGVLDQLAHRGLVKLLVEDALQTFTIPIAWEIFRKMTKEDDIKALTYDLSPLESEEEEQRGETRKEIHEEEKNTQMEEYETQLEKEENRTEKKKRDTTRDKPKAKKRK